MKYATDGDIRILELTAEIITEFYKLKQTHPNDLDDMVRAVHDVQRIIATRVAREVLPEKFISYDCDDVNEED